MKLFGKLFGPVFLCTLMVKVFSELCQADQAHREVVRQMNGPRDGRFLWQIIINTVNKGYKMFLSKL